MDVAKVVSGVVADKAVQPCQAVSRTSLESGLCNLQSLTPISPSIDRSAETYLNPSEGRIDLSDEHHSPARYLTISMDEPAQTLVFRGADADEAETFIQAIRQLAYREDKDDDNVWMARFATTCFRGRAMRWHAKLDVAVRRDWDLLVPAILDEWPMEVNDGNREEVAAPM